MSGVLNKLVTTDLNELDKFEKDLQNINEKPYKCTDIDEKLKAYTAAEQNLYKDIWEQPSSLNLLPSNMKIQQEGDIEKQEGDIIKQEGVNA